VAATTIGHGTIFKSMLARLAGAELEFLRAKFLVTSDVPIFGIEYDVKLVNAYQTSTSYETLLLQHVLATTVFQLR
jgi:hypothetical protein